MGQPPVPNFFCESCGYKKYIQLAPIEEPLDKCPECGSDNVVHLHMKEWVD